MAEEQPERLQKVIAQAGLTSRRDAEQWITAGRVTVNGSKVTELGTRVRSTDTVAVDGVPLSAKPPIKVYILLYKPTRVVTTVSDPEGRKTVIDLLPSVKERVFPVGRLDYETSGVLLLTNDGDLSHRLTHPRFHVLKTYEAVVEGRVTPAVIDTLTNGVELDDGVTAPATVEQLGTDGRTTRLLLTIHEGRNRQVRRMLEAVGLACTKLVRMRLGPLTLAGLRPGQYRYLTRDEVRALRDPAPLRLKGSGGGKHGRRRR